MKRYQLGLVLSREIYSNIAQLETIGDVIVLGPNNDDYKKTDLIVLPDNIGINPYASNIIGGTDVDTQLYPHKFLASHFKNIMAMGYSILGIGHGAVSLYSMLNCQSELIGDYIKYTTYPNMEYYTSKKVVTGFNYKNVYGLNEFNYENLITILIEITNDKQNY